MLWIYLLITVINTQAGKYKQEYIKLQPQRK